MAVYSARQSSYSDGDTITAAHTNDEFNAILATFNVSTGHTHDGSTAGDGGPISNLFSNALVFGTNADTDIAITFNANSNDGVLTWMEDEDYFQFSDDILLSTTEKLQFRDTAIYIHSSADGQLDLVADTEIQIAATTVDINGAVDVSGNLGVGGNLTVTGTTTFNGGTLTLGDADTDNIVFGGEVDSNIIPDDDDTYDLGSSSKEWQDLFIDGTANIDSLVADTADINGGTIDGAVIGGASAAAITGTAITGTSFVIGSADISEAELETIDGITAGTVAVSKAVVVDSNKDIGLFRNITLTGELDAGSLDVSGDVDVDGTLETDALSINGTAVTSTAAELNILDGVTSTAAELNILDGVTSTAAELNILDGVTASAADINLIDGITNGTVIASKAIITDANKDITGGRNITISGELDAATLDISGDADIDGTLEADAITIGGVTLAETISDTVGAMVTSNTETGIAVTYDDSDNTLDFVIGTLNQDTTGTATNATHVTVADNESTNEENLIPFIEDASATGNVGLESDGDFAYNPSTGTVSATIFKGNIDAVDGDFDGTLEADAITIGGTAIGSIYSAIAGSSSIVTTGALNSGSITSGFGTINNGSSDITTTGTVNFGSLADGTITVTAFVDEDDMSTNSATLVPTQQSVKAYADTKASAGFAVAMAIAL